MKVFAVIDHVCEADILVGVFSTLAKAKGFVKAHKDEPYSPHVNANKYDCLGIEDHDLDKP